MKKTILALVALMTVSLAAVSCGDSDKEEGKDSVAVAKAGQQKGEPFETAANYRYIDMDTLLQHYSYAVEQNGIIQAKMAELQNQQAQLANWAQSQETAIQQKAQSGGYATQEAYEQAVKAYQQQGQGKAQQYSQREQNTGKEIQQINEAVLKAIDDYIIGQNKTWKYDAILYKQSGLYFNPALDITKEVLEGLNNAHAAQPAAKEATADNNAKK